VSELPNMWTRLSPRLSMSCCDTLEKSVKKPMFTSFVLPNGTLAPRFRFGWTFGCITMSAIGGGVPSPLMVCDFMSYASFTSCAKFTDRSPENV